MPVGASVTDIQRHAGHPDRYASQGSNKVRVWFAFVSHSLGRLHSVLSVISQ